MPTLDCEHRVSQLKFYDRLVREYHNIQVRIHEGIFSNHVDVFNTITKNISSVAILNFIQIRHNNVPVCFFFSFESLTHRCSHQYSIPIATRGPKYQYSFLDFRLVTARNVQVQKHKVIINNHACPQSYNNFLYNVSKIIWFSIYNV